MAVTVEFGELPPDRRGGGRPVLVLSPIVDALKERPGEWAKVRSGVPRGTVSVYRQRLKALGCEATSRNTSSPDGADLWARWPEDAA